MHSQEAATRPYHVRPTHATPLRPLARVNGAYPVPRPTPGTNRRGDASVFRSAPRRDGTPARSGSAIVTREASPGPLAYFIDQGTGVANKHDTGTTVAAMHPCSDAPPGAT